MSDTRKCFTFIWKIKNFEFTFNKDEIFESPTFYVHEMFRTYWGLILYSDSSNHKNRIACYLEVKNSDFGPKNLKLGFELSFITGDESVIYSQLASGTLFGKGIYWSSPLSADRKEVYEQKKELFISDGVLTIRCRIWKNQGSMPLSARCSVETRINTKCIAFAGTIDNFSRIKPNSRNRVFIESQSDDFRISSMYLNVGENGKLDVEILPTAYQFEKNTYKVNVFILDDLKYKIKSCIGGIYTKEPFIIPLFLSKDHLIENKELYLLNDALTLLCEVIFSSNCELELIGDMIYEYECQDIQFTSSNPTSPNPYTENDTGSIITLRNGLISLFNEGMFCDINLKTTTEAFPAHKVVLSAQSSVFKSMFTIDMKEKVNSSVDIEDLDANTMRRMLLFLYLGTLNNLEYESARSLYFAADKYDIVSLKRMCSNFLMNSLLPSNCCEVLLLADKHQDMDLKRYALDYIAKNDERVFSSDKWKELEENQPRLIIETLRAVHSYMKTR